MISNGKLYYEFECDLEYKPCNCCSSDKNSESIRMSVYSSEDCENCNECKSTISSSPSEYNDDASLIPKYFIPLSDSPDSSSISIVLNNTKDILPIHYNLTLEKIKQISVQVVNINDTITISDNINFTVETNNIHCINISLKKSSTFFKKESIFKINFIKQGNGYIKVINCKSKETYYIGIYILGETYSDTPLIGSIYEDNKHYLDYWTDDIFLKNKYLDVVYYKVNDTDNLLNAISSLLNFCKKFGLKCVIIYNVLMPHVTLQSYNYYTLLETKLHNEEYMIEYMTNLNLLLNVIDKNWNIPIDIPIIYEPNLLSHIYNFDILVKNYRFFDVEQFIKKLNIKVNIDYEHIKLVNIVNMDLVRNLIFNINNVNNMYTIDMYIKMVNKHIDKMVDFYKQFETIKLLAFEMITDNLLLSTDEWNSYMYIIHQLLTKLDLKGIIYDIPVGIPLNCNKKSTYTNDIFPMPTNKNCDYIESSIAYLFGELEINNQWDIINKNVWNDINFNLKNYPKHLLLLKYIGIDYILLGPRSEKDNTMMPMKYTNYKCTDNHYTMQKIQEHFNNI